MRRFRVRSCRGTPMSSHRRASWRGADPAAQEYDLGRCRDIKPLLLVQARNLITNLALPALLTDADGQLLFFNDAAAALLGRGFEEVGRLPREDWAREVGPFDDQGRALLADSAPIVSALRSGRPAHGRFRARLGEAGVAEVEVSALPLLEPGHFEGALVCLLASRDRGASDELKAMQIRFWGVRGSIAVPNGRMLRYGGNTSCVEVTLAEGTEIILDAGTGIRELGEARTAQARIVRVLLTTCTSTTSRACSSSHRCLTPPTRSRSTDRRLWVRASIDGWPAFCLSRSHRSICTSSRRASSSRLAPTLGVRSAGR